MADFLIKNKTRDTAEVSFSEMCFINPSVWSLGLWLFLSSEPLPLHSVRIYDYKESPETGVVFQIEPPAGNVFSRVNISYTEGQERRFMLYKGLFWAGAL